MFRKIAIITAIITAVLAGTSVAMAYWNTSGTGTGTATVVTVKLLTITQAPITGLVLNRPAELAGSIHNSNDFDISLAQQALLVSPSIDDQHRKCGLDNFKVVTPKILDATAKANGTARFGAGSVTLLDLPDVDQQACQGATITFEYTLSTAN